MRIYPNFKSPYPIISLMGLGGSEECLQVFEVFGSNSAELSCLLISFVAPGILQPARQLRANWR